MINLLRASALSSGHLIDSLQLKEVVERVFPLCDKNNDGKLSFTEFKEAVFQDHIFISSFWTNPNFSAIFNK